MSSPVLEVQGLGKRYGKFTALDDVSFALQPGSITAILGPNGAGKTTTFKCILGVTGFDGSVTVDGYSSKKDGKKARGRIGYLPQTPAFNDGDTCTQLLAFLAELRGVDRARSRDLLDRVGLLEQKDIKIAHLSGGMQQRLALAAALLSDPPLLLLDEPTANLDATSREQLHTHVSQLRDEGRTVLISTHLVDNLGDLADRALVLRKGALLFDGTVDELAKKSPFKRFLVNLNGTSPSAFADALNAIGVKPGNIEPAGVGWEQLINDVTATADEAQERTP
jgi:ABC-type multidrug transport system ATPase subunit